MSTVELTRGTLSCRETEVVTDVSQSLFPPARPFFGALLLGSRLAAAWLHGARPSGRPLARVARATVPRSAAAPSPVRHAVARGTAALHRPAGCTGHCGRCAACPPNEGGAQQRLPPMEMAWPLSLSRATRGRPATTMRAPPPPRCTPALSAGCCARLTGEVQGVPLLLTCLTPRARDILADGKIWRCRSAPPCAPLRH
eukprot:SAG25_NODE_4253_length_855_cov_1.207672_1_plen_198_part_10